MATEPQLKRGSSPTNAYVNRWRHWYAAISDHMLANPGCTNEEIAQALHKHSNTISLICNTDLFRDYHAQRRQEFQQAGDFLIRQKLHGVASKSLDLMLEVMEKKKDQVPLGQLVSITNTALENLGYGPKAQAPAVVQVNNQQNNTTQVLAPVSANELAEAREALRRAEQKRLEEPAIEVLPPAAEREDSVDNLLDVEPANVPRSDQ